MNLLPGLATCFGSNIWPLSLEVTIFISAIGVAALCLKGFPSRFRYLLWSLVLVRLAIPVSFSPYFGTGRYLNRFSTTCMKWLQGLHIPAITGSGGDTKGFLRNSGVTAVFFNMHVPSTAAQLLFVLWCLGVFLLGLMVVIRMAQIRRGTGSFEPIVRPELVALLHRLTFRLELGRNIKLMQSDNPMNIPFPLVRGIFRPSIILPGSMARGWSTEALEPVLLHELSHIKKKDSLVNALQIVLQILYFYHPMVWLANWMIRRERELACDDAVVRYSGGSTAGYVRSLLQAAEDSVGSGSLKLLNIAMAENFSKLGRRIIRMTHSGYRVSERHGFIYTASVVLIAFFCTALSAQNPESLSAPASSSQIMRLAEFERMASEAATTSGIPQSIIADATRELARSRPNQIVAAQEWRSSILNQLYSKNVPYDLAVQFFSQMISQPVDTGYLDKFDGQNDSDVGPVFVVGHGIKPPIVLDRPIPAYTDEAKQAGVEGIVIVQFIIRKDGTVAHPVILKALGYGLDQSVIRTVMTQWRFEPGTLNGAPVDVQFNVEVTFRRY